ncbi:rod shape-determining protein [Streptomyces triculaminicus]|uniref:rod shape-determining protein n=1 Tax=Streptomyces triculaminicus TaxID=2816232 RepID=UPI0037D0BF01
MGSRTLIHSEHGIDIGPATARRVQETGSLVRRPGEPRVAVAGKDVVSGVPRQTPLAAEQVREVLRTSYSRICDLLVQVLELDPSDLLCQGETRRAPPRGCTAPLWQPGWPGCGSVRRRRPGTRVPAEAGVQRVGPFPRRPSCPSCWRSVSPPHSCWTATCR